MRVVEKAEQEDNFKGMKERKEREKERIDSPCSFRQPSGVREESPHRLRVSR